MFFVLVVIFDHILAIWPTGALVKADGAVKPCFRQQGGGD